MTAARGKRLRALEQQHAERARERWEALSTRALDLMPTPELKALAWQMRQAGTPEGDAALTRLRAWGEGVPDVRDAPDLGAAGAAWWERLGEETRPPLPPVASPEAVADLARYAGQWRAVAAREDCPEREAAEGLAGLWAWWAALARVTRGEGNAEG